MERCFECPICLEQFSSDIKPLLIPCGHTACDACINSLKNEQGLECPVCRALHHNLNVLNLSVNYALMVSEPKSTEKPSLWGKIEEIHKQTTHLKELQTTLEFNYDISRSSTMKIRNDAQQLYEMLSGIMNSSYKLLLTQVDDIEKEQENKMEKVKNQIIAVQSQKNDLLNSLQESYTNNQEINPNTKLQLLNIALPEFNINFASYTNVRGSNKPTKQLKKCFGTIEEVPIKEESKVVDTVMANAPESLSVDEKKNQNAENYFRGGEGGRGGRGGGGGGRGERGGRGGQAGRGRGDHREEGIKQPRQGKNDGVYWFVENRFGNWEKLPVWFDAQLQVASEKGEKTLKVFDKGRPKYLVNLEELKSYVILNSGATGKVNRIRYDPD